VKVSSETINELDARALIFLKKVFNFKSTVLQGDTGTQEKRNIKFLTRREKHLP